MKRIDINVDIGEGFPHDAALLEFATSANVCLGQHAGSWDLTLETVELCLAKGIRIGAHPGYPDRASMGRATPESMAVRNAYGQQMVEAMERFNELGVHNYVKPHGSFYNELTHKGNADSVLLKLMQIDKSHTLMGLPKTHHEQLASNNGWDFVKEGFADRGTYEDGTLIPRSAPGAMLEGNEILAQVAKIAPSVDSICIHGDTENCVEIASQVRTFLETHVYKVGP